MLDSTSDLYNVSFFAFYAVSCLGYFLWKNYQNKRASPSLPEVDIV